MDKTFELRCEFWRYAQIDSLGKLFASLVFAHLLFPPVFKLRKSALVCTVPLVRRDKLSHFGEK